VTDLAQEEAEKKYIYYHSIPRAPIQNQRMHPPYNIKGAAKTLASLQELAVNVNAC